MENPKLIPEINIGMVGHVAHGKTTLVEAITGITTLRHSEELKRGITIRLGYADATIYKCGKCGRYSTTKRCPYCFSDTEPQRTVSFVDAPGHETLMATVLTGTALMDGAILVISANEKCPQPQTREHLKALEVSGIKNVIIVQNKIDLVSKEQALKNYKEIKEFIKGSSIEEAPIIPISAQKRINIDVVLEAIQNFIPTPKRDENVDPLMLVARSFDINKPGIEPSKIKGGVLGGSVVRGVLRVEDDIEIRPGIKKDGAYRSLVTKIESLQKGGKNVEKAGPGGLLGVLTQLDPFLTKSDRLSGNIVGLPGRLPETRESLRLQVHLLERIVGFEKVLEIEPIRVNEALLINAWTAKSVGVVTSVKENEVEIKLKLPVCIEEKERIVISRQISGRWRLIGYGVVI